MQKKFIILVLLLSGIFCFGRTQFKRNQKRRIEDKVLPENVVESTGEPKKYFTKEEREKFDEKVKKGLDLENKERGNEKTGVQFRIKDEKIYRENLEKEMAKTSGKLRKLSETNTLTKLGFFSVYQDGSSWSEFIGAQKYVITKTKKEESKFILYPYSFSYTNTLNQINKSETGGFFALNLTDLGENTDFKKIMDISSVQIGKSKAVYDIDIAILSLPYEIEGQQVDLFSDAYSFCDYFSTIGKISTCLEGKDQYLIYKGKYPTKGAAVKISHEDILNLTLYDGLKLNFKLLVIPDHLLGNTDTINSKYTQEVIDKIKEFRDKGGNIFVSGKSGYLLETWGILPSGTYNTLKTFSPSQTNYGLTGCENNKYNTPENSTDYFKQLMCLDVAKYYQLEQMYEMKQIPSDFETIANFKGEGNLLYMKEKVDGEEKKIDDTSILYPLAVASKEETNSIKGRILISNGKSVGSYYYSSIFRNFMYFSMTRNALLDIKLKYEASGSEDDDLPIPGGEEGVQLATSFKLYNLYEKDMKNINIALFFLKDVELELITGSDSRCTLSSSNADYLSKLPSNIVNTGNFLSCSISTLGKLTSFEYQLKLEIKSQSVTKNGTDISFIFPFLSYLDTETGVTVNMDINPFMAQSKLAAVLRGTLNPDPSGYYPIPGRGVFFDNALSVENKENTDALKVNYISILPLISPIVDGNDESLVSQMLPVFEEYYQKHNYNYPWLDPYKKDVDYIDWVEFANQDVIYSLDFDTPVKLSKVMRDDMKGKINDLFDPTGKTIEKDSTADGAVSTGAAQLLKEIYFGDSEKFYEKASQRRFLFVDTSTEKGAAIAFKNGIPESLKDPYNSKRTKREFGFTRVDIFFYGSMFGQYQIPNGLDETVLMSIDKYDQSSVPCDGEKLGTRQSKKVVQGHFNSSLYDPTNPGNTLKPNEYSNVLRQYSYLHKYDPTNSEDLAALQAKATDKLSLTHYLLPFVSDGIERAGSILHFKEDEVGGEKQKSGYMEQYPSLRFIYAHLMNVTLSPNVTRIGGKVELELPVGFKNNEDPVTNERITISADNVAFYKTVYEPSTKIITLYFKRGLMPNENAGGDSKCQVYIENLNTEENINIKMKIYNLKYDFTVSGFESYKSGETTTISGVYVPFWSFPAVYLENTLYRTSTFENDTPDRMAEYELVNPYARYGMYFQELTKHTTVWGSMENHPIKDPGFTGKSGGFSLISNVGTSFVPFAEYLSTGILKIPAAVSTSRLEWNDVWGRKWVQNLRSIYPDIPPIPPAPLSFLMTTTFELLTDDSKEERLLEWTSDETVNIRVQMKFINTYNKYWEPVMCLKNQLPFVRRTANDYGNPHELEEEIKRLSTSECQDGSCDANLGFARNYGICYQSEGSYLNGTKITTEIAANMGKMVTCAQTNDAEKMSNCSKQADEWGLPQLKKLPDSITDDQNQTPEKKWNYSPDIIDYFPKGYTDETELWTFHKFDYYDDAFYKAYPFHNDNCLPGLDVGINANMAWYKPHNLAAFPIFKGLGYNIEYDQTYKLRNARYNKYSGWWSDQLQNKDHTLLAGQEKVNEFAVGSDLLIKDSDWIHANEIKNVNNTNLIENRKKNIYVCKYNQHRIRIKPGQNKYSWAANVYQNNVVPVIPDLRDDAPEYTKYDCTGENAYQYDNYNISKVDNRVKTSTDRDWLYFAVAIRGNSKEDINVVLKLSPIGKDARYEGITKVQDGGRFTYWVPVNGPNSYLYNDCPVNTVIGKRVDLQIEQAAYPTNLFTFDSDVYYLFTIFDEQEKDREYTMSTYMNSHGYGDSTVSVYVGGTDGTKCKIEPGEFSYVKIVFYNNAGFDWNMKGNAIEFEDSGQTVTFNADQLMKGTATNIQFPKKYNFMSYEIPSEIKDYVTLTPSLHRVDLAPQFFDLTFDNTVSIKDSLESDYYYCLNVTSNFPDKYKGKLWEIKMTLNEQYFDRLPGHNDPTGIHEYTLTIPSIRFGVPLNGKIYYVLGQAKNLQFTFNTYKFFEVEGIKIVTDAQAAQLSLDVSDKENRFNNLQATWNSINSYQELDEKIEFNTINIEDSYFKTYNVSLSNAYPLFPFERQQKSFQTTIKILVKAHSSQVPGGYNAVLTNSRVYYNDGRKNKNTYVNYPNWIQSYATGPWITASTSNEVVELDSSSGIYVKSADQTVYNGDTKIFNVTFTLKNTGTESSFKSKFEIKLNKNAKIMTEYGVINDLLSYTIDSSSEDYNLMKINYDGTIFSQDYIKFKLPIKMTVGEIEKIQESNVNRRTSEKTIENRIVKEIDIKLCKSDVVCSGTDSNSAIQIIEIDSKISYKTESNIIGKVHIESESIGTDKEPKYRIKASLVSKQGDWDESQINYIFRKVIIKNSDTYNTEEIVLTGVSGNTVEDSPLTTEQLEDQNNYRVEYYGSGTVNVNANLKQLNSDNLLKFIYNKTQENEKNKLIWPIILGITLGIVLLASGSYLFYKYIYLKKLDRGTIINTGSVSQIKPASDKTKEFDPYSKNELVLKENKKKITRSGIQNIKK